MHWVSRAAAASALAGLAIALGASAVLAECPPGEDDLHLDVRYAFVATVAEASRDVGPRVPDSAPFDWHLELDVDRIYAGDVPDTIAFDGWDAGCSAPRGDQMTTGDRVFITSEHFRLTDLPRNPMWGDFLMWRWVDGRWAFYEEATGWTGEDRWLTAAMQNASSTSSILRLVRASVPDTATDGAMVERNVTRGPVLLVAFVVGALLLVVRVRRGDTTR